MQYTIYPARPVARPGRLRQLRACIWRFRYLLGMTNGGLALVVIGMAWVAPGTVTPGASQAASSRQPIAPAPSWIEGGTLLTMYGRGFRTAPVLGQLGDAKSFDDLARRTAGARQQIELATHGSPVRMAIHLIYGLAIPCKSTDDACLLYLDDGAGVDVVRQYIEPAAQRGWLVILDDQLGRSTPAREMERLRAKGYLAYDNVEVAFDPEFHTLPDQARPGNPPGRVTAEELDAAERVMEGASAQSHVTHRKLMLVHQWTPEMIPDRAMLTTDYRYVQPGIIMDGIGPASEKAGMYVQLLPPSLPTQGIVPGIKLFLPNPYDATGSWDRPLLAWPQLLAGAPVRADDGSTTLLRPAPRIIVLS